MARAGMEGGEGSKNAEPQPAIFGVNEFDDAIGGSFRRGNIYMISGSAGTGKTTACTQFLVQGARDGERGAIILTSERGEEYIANAKTFSFGFEKHYREGTIEVIELQNGIWEMKNRVKEDAETGKEYVSKLTSMIKKIAAESNIKRLAIDPITPLIVDDYDFMGEFFRALAIPQTYMMVTSGVTKGKLSFFGYEEYKVDGVMLLEAEEGDGRKFSVVKMPYGAHNSEPVHFSITKEGMVAGEAAEEGHKQLFRRRVV